MAITIGSILIPFVALIALYNKLAPRPISDEIRATNFSSNLDLEQEASAGMNNYYYVTCHNFIVLLQIQSLRMNT
jgi:hypothetical protein